MWSFPFAYLLEKKEKKHKYDGWWERSYLFIWYHLPVLPPLLYRVLGAETHWAELLWAKQCLLHCLGWDPSRAGCCTSPCLHLSPDRKQSLPLFVAAWIHILMVSLIPQKLDLLWGNCYIAAKRKLLLSVVTWAYTPSLTKKREFLHHLVQNTHLPKTAQRTHLATQSSHFPERFNEKVCLKLKIHIYINCR